MKKILIILIVLAGSIFAQPKDPNATILDSLGVFSDTLYAHKIRFESLEDTNAVQRTAINAVIDSTELFSDTLYQHKVDLAAIVDTNEAQRTDINLKLNLSGGTLTGNLDLGDNISLRAGASQDLSLYHDANNSVNNIVSTGFELRFGNTTAHGITFYTNNTKRYEINSSGNIIPGTNGTLDLGSSSYKFNNVYTEAINLDGTDLATTIAAIQGGDLSQYVSSTGDTMTGDLNFGNGDYAIWGADDDIGIYHDSATPANNIVAANAKLNFGTTTSHDIELYTNNTKRLTLNSSGHTVPGTSVTYDLGATAYWFRSLYSQKVLFRTAYSNDSPSGAELSIPSHLTHPTTAGTFRHNDIYTLSQDSYFDVAGNVQDKNGFYLLAYYDEDPLTRPYFPDSTEIENMVDARLMASAKTLSQVDTDSIDFTNTNTIFGYYQASDEFEVYFANYQSNIAQQIVIYTQYDININAPAGVTLLYADGLPITVSGTGYYRIWFTYLSSTLCLVDWNMYEAP